MELQSRPSVSLGESRTPEHSDYDIEVKCVKSQINLQSVDMGCSCSASLPSDICVYVACPCYHLVFFSGTSLAEMSHI